MEGFRGLKRRIKGGFVKRLFQGFLKGGLGLLSYQGLPLPKLRERRN